MGSEHRVQVQSKNHRSFSFCCRAPLVQVQVKVQVQMQVQVKVKVQVQVQVQAGSEKIVTTVISCNGQSVF